MGRYKVALHTHSSASPDAALTPREVVKRHRDAGFDAVAITDHNVVTEPPAVDDIITIKGVEWTISRGLGHLLEYPNHNVRILPHPKLSGFGDLATMTGIVSEYDVDAVEKYNRGHLMTKSVPLNTVPVSTSDFHHPGDEEYGHIEVEADRKTGQSIMNALQEPENVWIHRRYNPVDLPSRVIASIGNVLGIGKRVDESNISSDGHGCSIGRIFGTACGRVTPPEMSDNSDGSEDGQEPKTPEMGNRVDVFETNTGKPDVKPSEQ